ncbi:hypothetical protein QOT17_022674 [Balamuthia mandrillaris]
MEEEEEENEEKEEEEKKKKQDKKDEKTVEPFELSVIMLFDQTRLRAFHHFCQLQYSSPSTVHNHLLHLSKTLRWLLTFDTMAKHLLPINTAQRFLHESAQDAKMQLRTHTSMIYNETEMTSSGQFFVPQERLAFGEWNLQRWNKIVQTYFGSIKDQTKEKDKKEEREKEKEEKEEEDDDDVNEDENDGKEEEDIQHWGLKKAAWQAQCYLINMTTDLMQGVRREVVGGLRRDKLFYEEHENDDGSKTTNFYASVGKEKRMRKTDQVPFPTELHSFFQFFILKIRPWLLVPSTQNPQVNFDPLCIWVGDNGNAMELNYFAKESKEDFEDGVSTYLNVTKSVIQNHYNRHSTFKRSQEVLKILGAPEMEHLSSHLQQASQTHAQLLLQLHQHNHNSPFASRQMELTRPIRTSTSDKE